MRALYLNTLNPNYRLVKWELQLCTVVFPLSDSWKKEWWEPASWSVLFVERRGPLEAIWTLRTLRRWWLGPFPGIEDVEGLEISGRKIKYKHFYYILLILWVLVWVRVGVASLSTAVAHTWKSNGHLWMVSPPTPLFFSVAATFRDQAMWGILEWW